MPHCLPRYSYETLIIEHGTSVWFTSFPPLHYGSPSSVAPQLTKGLTGIRHGGGGHCEDILVHCFCHLHVLETIKSHGTCPQIAGKFPKGPLNAQWAHLVTGLGHLNWSDTPAEVRRADKAHGDQKVI